MNAQSKIAAGPQVYTAIAAVQGELAKIGIAKNRRNTQGSGYNFRGIDDVYSALSPLLAQHGLVIVPRMISRDTVERQSKNGGALFYVTVEAEFDFVSVSDGSTHTARTFGEAMDSGDKATSKAMSAAYKYAAFMAFAIPTEGDNDADATTHDVESNALIDDNQWATLTQMIEATVSDTRKFCEWAGIRSVRELPARHFDKAISKLQAKAKKSATNPQRDEVLADEIPY